MQQAVARRSAAARCVAKPWGPGSRRPVPALCRAGAGGKAPSKASAGGKAPSKARGIRYDATMLRWVRDDRFGEMETTVVQPKTGVAYTVWPVIHQELTSSGVKGVTTEQAAKMMQQGWTLVDTRIAGDFDKGHIAGSVSVPLFRIVQGTAFWDQVKKAVMSGLAMKATERDPDFVEKFEQVLRKNSKVILACAIGGTLDTKLRLRPDKYKDGIDDPERNFGRESRSLKAAHELVVNGGWSGNNVTFLLGGVQQWRFEKRPMESS